MKGLTFIEIDGELWFSNIDYELKIHDMGNNNEQIVHKGCDDKCEVILRDMVKVGDIK